jgi:hypothetical protein
VTAARVSAAKLGTLIDAGRGGQGRVFTAAGVRLAGGVPAVYKEYVPEVRADVAIPALERMVAFLAELDPLTRRALTGRAAWPVALVERDGEVTGFLMRAVPAEYRVDLDLPAGRTRRLAGVQYLLNGTAYLRRLGLVVTDRVRLHLLHDVAQTLAMLHELGVAVGDLSPNNLLFSISGRCCFFIDCDGMRVRGSSALAQTETPDWAVGEVSPEELATPASDAYKLGLLAVRIFSSDQSARDPEVLAPHGPALVDLARRALDPDPDARPAPAEWLAPLTEAADPAPPPPQPRASWFAGWDTGRVVVAVLIVLAVVLVVPWLMTHQP